MRKPSDSIAFALEKTSYKTKMCARFVFECLGAPVLGIADANEAWDRSESRMTTRTPPKGVPVWFRGGKHGHVALSLGGGRIRSTDWPRAGKVGTTTVDELERAWSFPYRGWADNWAGHDIPGLNGGGPAPSTGHRVRRADLVKGRDNTSIKHLQRRLTALGFSVPATGFFGDLTEKALRKWQRSQGWQGANADGAMGPVTFARLFPVPPFQHA